jgi:signal transduction histidine kinase
MLYVALLTLAFGQLVLGIVLSYKKHDRVSKAFIYFTFALFAWTLANTALAYALHSGETFSSIDDRLMVLNWGNRIGFASGTVTLALLYRLVLVFPLQRKLSKFAKWTIIAGFIFGFVALFPVVAGTYTLESLHATPVYIYGALSNLVTLYYVVVAVEALRAMVGGLRKTNDPLIKSQIKTILFGLLTTTFLAIMIIIVIPLIVGDDSFLVLGYFTPFIFTAAVFYSIFRQGFLNFQAFVARSIGYILTVVVLGLLFMAAAVTAARLFSGGSISGTDAILFAALSILIALAFGPVKRFFDKITNRLFYRDAYETQNLLNDLNASLVTTLDVQVIMQNTALLIEHYLKPSYVTFHVLETDRVEAKSFSTSTEQTLKMDGIKTLLVNAHAKVLDTSQLAKSNERASHILEQNNVGVVAQLITSESGDQVIGVVVLGNKKSGSIYDKQDLRVMGIIADELVIAVQNALRFEEIQQFNITLQEKVDDATKKLRNANEKLIAMDQTKDDFISMASHQLRTPLTSVKGYVSMVLEGDVGKITKEQRKLLDQSFLSSQRMVYLVGDLLNVSRLRTGKFVIETKPTNLADVVEGELEQLKETAVSRDLKVAYDKPKSFPTLELDETKIRQVIMNFVDNAIYYTPAGGNITVSLVDNDETIEFTVADDGIGVPKAEQHNLFNKFYRAGNAKKARPDGTGLGLFMAKKVVIAQGGAIIFKTQEGKGSTFGFSFEKKKLQRGTHTVTVTEDNDTVPDAKT